MYFPSNFPVSGVGLVRNSVDELFVEGTCNVFGVDVCVVLESYRVVDNTVNPSLSNKHTNTSTMHSRTFTLPPRLLSTTEINIYSV